MNKAVARGGNTLVKACRRKVNLSMICVSGEGWAGLARHQCNHNKDVVEWRRSLYRVSGIVIREAESGRGEWRCNGV